MLVIDGPTSHSTRESFSGHSIVYSVTVIKVGGAKVVGKLSRPTGIRQLLNTVLSIFGEIAHISAKLNICVFACRVVVV